MCIIKKICLCLCILKIVFFYLNFNFVVYNLYVNRLEFLIEMLYLK